MINWIMTIIGLILLIAYYQLIGSSFFIWINVKRNRFAFNLISGFILTWALGWIVGFPCELFSTSWNFFAIVFSIVLVGITGVALFLQWKFNEKLKIFVKKDFKEKLTIVNRHILYNVKCYWFIYLFVIIFSALSITNMQPYTLNNYNDDHYIVRVLHLYKSQTLFNEDYYSGTLLEHSGIFGYALQQGQRIFNTYELNYSYVGSLLHINLIFFCRVTMIIHNYFIVFMLYTLFASIFIKEKYAQYSIMFFSILMIPSGYLAKANIPIRVRMWENWRFQTAMYMGGSVVRVCAFPAMFYYFYSWIINRLKRNILFFIPIFIALISFQTTAVSYILIIVPIFVVSTIVYYICKDEDLHSRKELKQVLVRILVFSFLIVILLIGIDQLIRFFNLSISSKFNLLDRNSKLNVAYLKQNAADFKKYYRDVFTFDFFAKFVIVPFLVIAFLKKGVIKKVILYAFICLYFIFATDISPLLLSLVSFQSYCTARILTAVQLMCVIMFGICVVSIIERLNWHNLIIPIVSIAMVISIASYAQTNSKKILKYSGEGDGITSGGYSLKTITNNSMMLAPVFKDIGDYFNGLKNKKYILYSEDTFKIKGTTYENRGLLMASKNIRKSKNYINHYTKSSKEEQAKLDFADWAITVYIAGTYQLDFYHNYKKAEPYIKAGKIYYIFTTRENIQKDLCHNNWKIVRGSSRKGYWLLKRLS